jgi:hypothetical protein
MKKIPLLITLVVGTSLVVPKVHAQEATQPLPEKVAPTPSLIQNIKETFLGTDDKPAFLRDVEDKKEQMRKFREDKLKADAEAATTADTTDQTKGDATVESKIKDRVTDTIEKLDGLATRIASRIEKLKKAGANVQSAEAALKKARDAQADAELQYELLEWNALDTEAIKANADVLKTIRADVVAVHAYLTEAVKALKDAQTTLEQSATIVATKEVK